MNKSKGRKIKGKTRKTRKTRKLYGGGGQPYRPIEVIRKTETSYNNSNVQMSFKNKRLERLLQQAEKDKKRLHNHSQSQSHSRQR